MIDVVDASVLLSLQCIDTVGTATESSPAWKSSAHGWITKLRVCGDFTPLSRLALAVQQSARLRLPQAPLCAGLCLAKAVPGGMPGCDQWSGPTSSTHRQTHRQKIKC